jgi:hypothetical protein
MNLSLEVTTRNAVNLKAMDAQQRVVEILTPYLGKKARKVSGYGGWVAKLEPEFERFTNELRAEGFRAWVSCDYRWLNLRIDATYNVQELVGGGHAVAYVKQSVSIGKIDDSDGELIELFDLANLRTDYTVDWVETTRAEAYRLESEALELHSSLRDFS